MRELAGGVRNTKTVILEEEVLALELPGMVRCLLICAAQYGGQ